jgi:hypothetical protein
MQFDAGIVTGAEMPSCQGLGTPGILWIQRSMVRGNIRLQGGNVSTFTALLVKSKQVTPNW